jgi:hypothetical protein
MNGFGTIDPVVFTWDRFGRHLSDRPRTGDIRVDLQDALSRSYPMVADDMTRLVGRFRNIAIGLSKETVAQAVGKLAGFQVAHDVVAAGFHESLDAGIIRALASACAAIDPRKIKPRLPECRLGPAMLAIIANDRKPFLRASIRPANPDGIELVPCGARKYMDYIVDLIREPPTGQFVVIEFAKAPVPVESLVMHLSPHRMRLRSGTIDRPRLLAAIDALHGVDIQAARRLSDLVALRGRDIDSIEEIDKDIRKLRDSLGGADIVEMARLLPETGSAEWRILEDMMSPGSEPEGGEDMA